MELTPARGAVAEGSRRSSAGRDSCGAAGGEVTGCCTAGGAAGTALGVATLGVAAIG